MDRGLAIATVIGRFRNGQTEVLVSNFSAEYRHLNRGTTIDFFDELTDIRDTSALFGQSAEDLPTFDINQALHQHRQELLPIVVRSYSDYFSASSKVQQTPIAKHRIVTDEHIRTLRLSSYLVSARERQAIRDQVEEMLRDYVIQPLKSP